jgi:FSR family fosmidomycin resistance protein-like MFS transporter
MSSFNLRMLLLLALGHLVTDIYQGALSTLLPFLKEKLALSYTTAGAILMTSNITSSIIQPIFGMLSDKKGKAVLLPLGALCAGVGFSLLAWSPNYFVVLALVLVSGLGVAAYHPEGYKTATFFTGEKRATGMSVFTVGGNLGFALGPILTLLVIQYLGLPWLPLMALPAILFVLFIMTAWKTLSEHHEAHAARQRVPSDPIPGARAGLALVIATVVVRSWTQFGLMSYIPFYYIDHLKGDPLYAGSMVSIFLLGGVVGTLSGSPLADRWGHKKVLMLSMGLTAAIFPCIFLVDGMALFAVFAMLGMALIASFTVTIVMAQHLLPNNLGVASGLTVGFAIGTGGVGVTILGLIADAYGVPAALRFIGVLPVAGLLISLCIRYPAQSR